MWCRMPAQCRAHAIMSATAENIFWANLRPKGRAGSTYVLPLSKGSLGVGGPVGGQGCCGKPFLGQASPVGSPFPVAGFGQQHNSQRHTK